jgi:hypothetical protein
LQSQKVEKRLQGHEEGELFSNLGVDVASGRNCNASVPNMNTKEPVETENEGAGKSSPQVVGYGISNSNGADCNK